MSLVTTSDSRADERLAREAQIRSRPLPTFNHELLDTVLPGLRAVIPFCTANGVWDSRLRALLTLEIVSGQDLSSVEPRVSEWRSSGVHYLSLSDVASSMRSMRERIAASLSKEPNTAHGTWPSSVLQIRPSYTSNDAGHARSILPVLDSSIEGLVRYIAKSGDMALKNSDRFVPSWWGTLTMKFCQSLVGG